MHGLGTLLLFHIVTSLGQNVNGIIHGEKAPKNEMGNHVCGGFLVRNDFAIIAAYCLNEEVKLKVHWSDILYEGKVPEDSMQYMVSVQSNTGHQCGGFLINEEYVVTAAHCGENDLKYVLLGDHNLKSSKIKKVSINSSCKPQEYKYPDHGKDIMLLRLSEKVLLNNDLKTIPLALSERPLKDNQECSVAGWGKTEQSDHSDDLRIVNVEIINQETCQKQWENKLPDNVICAGGFGINKGFCQGDSGGPLVCDGTAVGVASFNRAFYCHYPDIPNVYTDISKYLHWLNKVVNEKKCT